MPTLPTSPLITKLLALNLPAGDFAVFGSGPMWAHGLRESRDLDIIARGRALEFVKRHGTPGVPVSGVGLKHSFADGAIEVFSEWGPGEWDINALIDGADIFDGIRFVKLEEVAKWKRGMGRPKDLADLELIDAYRRRCDMA